MDKHRWKETNMKMLLLAGLLAAAVNAWGQASKPAAGAADPALVDAILQKLEASGALDAAIERAFGRIQRKQEEEQRAAEAQRQALTQQRAKALRKASAPRDHI